jgi:hypothetical protein
MSYSNFEDWVNSTSKSLQDQAVACFLTALMMKIFGSQILSEPEGSEVVYGQIIISSENETDENHQLIKDNWHFIEHHLGVPRRILTTKKLVRQTFKYIIEHINFTYNLDRPIKFIAQKITIRQSKDVVNRVNVLTEWGGL